ncbi:MAG: hypothetical protein FJ395_11795 [Verrucomicrobia bacterium]|nr:hypothetical protein [Verrucomicrobiota bacterium]
MNILLALITLAAGFTFKDTKGKHLDVLQDGKLLARYMCAYDNSSPEKIELTGKPFLHVFDPDGKTPITNGPGGEYPHHRGIFIGWRKLTIGDKSYNFWGMNDGHQVHRKFVMRKDKTGFTSLVDWTTAEGKVLLTEERAFTFLSPARPSYAVIETTSKIKTLAGEAILDGDPEHAGLQFRAANEMERESTEYIFPKENADPKTDRDYPWVGLSYTLGGKQYSVVYLNHPSNPKDAITSAYRDYGRFGMFAKDTIPAGGEKTFRVRFLVIAGAMPSADVIQKAYNQFAGVNDPTPKVTVKKAEKKAPPKPKKVKTK